ncbi:PREDICTED: protein ERGIC-53 isoform X2 [Dinoponera quadriceps]|uniref:Protein ERGIC-53 isoform X2 n=1 Tax=Dinoponera quadriceps TaxID=609295 RepID=A0A6P3X945_DINQU|nr:PREDICTED: protein ERGIC-53 isoform X2 [Dinoponera quadriceps]
MKMAAEVRWLLVFLICCAVSPGRGETPHRKFEYKYSFKPPYLAQKDGSIPFWEYGGNAIASSENVRVAPSLRSQKGAIWAKQPINFDWWEVDIVFRITGRGRIGADGLAVWYTTAKGAYNGTVFGSSDMWTGLGIFFDSFDNDNKHNNPYIMAVVNDGTKVFDHTSDGSSQQLAGCLRDFRNKPFATRARIEYYKNTLTLMFHNGMTKNEQDYDICFRVDNVVLPKNGYFGISAATGGLADDHDVLHFLTTSLYPPGQLPVDGHKVSVEEQAKLNKEYLDYQKKLEEQKNEYRKEHPDRPLKSEFEDYFETQNQRELRQVFDAQGQMFEMLRELHNKLDEVVGRQEITLSLMTQQAGGAKVSGSQAGQPALLDTIRRQEVDAVLNNQNIILSTAREIKSFVNEVHSKAESILNNQARAPTAQPMGYDYQSLISEMRDGLNTLKRDIRQTNTGNDCPTTNCLTTTMFLLFVGIQMIILLAYSLYRDNKEAQMKKLY